MFLAHYYSDLKPQAFSPGFNPKIVGLPCQKIEISLDASLRSNVSDEGCLDRLAPLDEPVRTKVL